MSSRLRGAAPHRLVGGLVFLLALAVRSGPAQIPPFDDLYHLKRIEWSAAHFPQVLDYDLDRGIGGGFCPWPPLYDVAAAAVQVVFGGVNWLPPIFFASFAALVAFAVGKSLPPLHSAVRLTSAAVAGLTIALSPYLIGVSARSHIDHHYVEPLLLLLIVLATVKRRGILLGLAIAAALLVQTAMLVAAGMAFAALWLESGPPANGSSVAGSGDPATCGRGRPLSAAVGFALAAAIVLVWRVTRAPDYPDSAWFLGYPHAAALAGAAIALLLTRFTSPLIALGGGVASALAVPSFAPAFFGGIGFFRGDPWLRTILEFQPMFNQSSLVGTDLANLTGGAVLSLFFFRRYRTFSLFSAAYLILALSSRRFLVPAIPLFAIGGALAVAHARRRWTAIAAAALTLIPPVAYDLYAGIPPARHGEVTRFASQLRDLPRGRVLGPWSYGHAIDVIGHQPVVIDNFGSMPDPALFDAANDALRLTRTDIFLAWCRAHRVRYVVLSEPRAGLRSSAAVTGLSPAFYDGTPLARQTVWWRLYDGRERNPAFRQVMGGRIQMWEIGS